MPKICASYYFNLQKTFLWSKLSISTFINCSHWSMAATTSQRSVTPCHLVWATYAINLVDSTLLLNCDCRPDTTTVRKSGFTIYGVLAYSSQALYLVPVYIV